MLNEIAQMEIIIQRSHYHGTQRYKTTELKTKPFGLEDQWSGEGEKGIRKELSERGQLYREGWKLNFLWWVWFIWEENSVETWSRSLPLFCGE